MANITHMINDYKIFKNNALKNEPFKKTISINEIKFHSDTCIEVQGVQLAVSVNAFRDLCRILSLSQTFNKRVSQSVDEEYTSFILNTIKSAIGQQNHLHITLLLNSKRSVLRVFDCNTAIMSYENFFHITERIIDRNTLDLSQICVNEQGELIMTTRQEKSDFAVKGFSDEVLNPD